MHHDELPMVAVYASPSDYPGQYVARRFWVGNAGVITAETDPLSVTTSLEELRAIIPPGMVRIGPMPGEDQNIVETWI